MTWFDVLRKQEMIESYFSRKTGYERPEDLTTNDVDTYGEYFNIVSFDTNEAQKLFNLLQGDVGYHMTNPNSIESIKASGLQVKDPMSDMGPVHLRPGLTESNPPAIYATHDRPYGNAGFQNDKGNKEADSGDLIIIPDISDADFKMPNKGGLAPHIHWYAPKSLPPNRLIFPYRDFTLEEYKAVKNWNNSIDRLDEGKNYRVTDNILSAPKAAVDYIRKWRNEIDNPILREYVFRKLLEFMKFEKAQVREPTELEELEGRLSNPFRLVADTEADKKKYKELTGKEYER
tara:strand:- start:2266 stop:3132 length:867 start_codon:yes stop_codon:yes gene_type:complete